MSLRVGPIDMGVDDAATAAGGQSVSAAFAAIDGSLAILGRLADRFPALLHRSAGEGVELAADFVDLVTGKEPHLATVGAGKFVARVEPSELYREFVAAIADERNVEIADSHGWPILSVGGDTPTVAGTGGRASASGEGQS